MPETRPWWQTAVFYEVYVRSFADGNDDGVGDLTGIRTRLAHIAGLGVDALWLTPFYPSPMADHGYDVADPRGVEPVFGTLGDFDALVDEAHGYGLRVIVDVVPNHVSSAHPWFEAAVAGEAGGPERARFLFREGRGPDGAAPPTNWRSAFGGSAWTRVPDGQWYLHLFAREQPDLDWRNPEVAADFETTLRFWLDRGVDGFRIDVAHGLFKDPALPDNPPGVVVDLMSEESAPTPMWDQPGVHDVWRQWRRLCDTYPQDPVLVGEVWLGDARAQARYVRPDELHLAFNFRLLFSAWEGQEMAAAIDRSVTALHAVGAPSTWVLSNHDVVRHVTRYGGGERGRRRARAALLLVLALPGAAFLYQGEELGLAEADVPDEALTDPVWERSGRTRRGRDGCRVPLPWSGTAPPYGFCVDASPWLPQPAGWAALTVQAEDADLGSTLAFYRLALARRPRADPLAPITWHRRDTDVLDLSVGKGVRCLVNLGDDPMPLPAGAAVLLASDDVSGGTVPGSAAVWLGSDETLARLDAHDIATLDTNGWAMTSVLYAVGSGAAIATDGAWLLLEASPEAPVVRQLWARLTTDRDPVAVRAALTQSDLSSFALVLAGPGLVLAGGRGRVEVEGGESPLAAPSGADGGWAEGSLPAGTTAVTLRCGADAADAQVPALAGVFPAASLEVRWAPAPAPAPAVPPRPTTPPPVVPPPPLVPPPVVPPPPSSPPPTSEAPDEPTEVLAGTESALDGFFDQEALAPLPEPPAAPPHPAGPPPSAPDAEQHGALLISTGQRVVLDRGAVLGRSPEWHGPDPRHLVTVVGSFGDVSRSHVGVSLDDDGVQVEDLGSTNGTLVAQPGAPQHLLRVGVAERLEPGAVVTLSRDVSFTYEIDLR